jgi:prepilin-type N-terminal cleavage/methylation domain-containing protein
MYYAYNSIMRLFPDNQASDSQIKIFAKAVFTFRNSQFSVRCKNGFTVIEVLITILVFAIAMIGITNMRALSLNGSFFNKDATTASSLAQKKLEDLKNTPYSSINSGSSQQNNMNIAWEVVPGSTSVTDGGTTVIYNFKDVTVSVTWKQKKIELFTVISEI